MRVHNYHLFHINDIQIISILRHLHGEVGSTNSIIRERDGIKPNKKETRNHKQRPLVAAKLAGLPATRLTF